MEVVVRKQSRDKTLTLHFSIMYKEKSDSEKQSEVFNIDDLAEIQFNFKNCSPFKISTSLTLRKPASAQNSTVKLDVSSAMLKYSQEWTCTEHWIRWQLMNNCQYDSYINEYRLCVVFINITVIEEKPFTGNFFYQDSEFTDFILSTTDGSIAVHKAVLAANSDMFKTMLSQEWKETAEGRVQIEGVSLQTLQHLKEYMYLGTLPDDGLRPLLQLAMCYLIEDLKSACISKLARTVKSADLEDLVSFSFENKMTDLIFALLQLTPDTIVHEAYQLKKKEANGEKAEKE